MDNISNNLNIKFKKWELKTINNDNLVCIDYKRDLEKVFKEYKNIFEKIHIDDLNDIFKIINVTIHMFEYVSVRKQRTKRLRENSLNKIFDEFKKTFFHLQDLNKFVDGESKVNIESIIENYKELLIDIDILSHNKKCKCGKDKFHNELISFVNPNKTNIITKDIIGHSHNTFKSNSKYRDIDSNYKRLTDSFLGSQMLSYKDIMRIALIKLKVLIPEKEDIFYNIMNLIFNGIFTLFKAGYFKPKSLMDNKQSMKYHFIYLPNVYTNNNKLELCSTVCLMLNENDYIDKNYFYLLHEDDNPCIAPTLSETLQKYNISTILKPSNSPKEYCI